MVKRHYHEWIPDDDQIPDADEILRAIQDSYAYHGNLAESLRQLLARGIGDIPGLAEILERLRARRDELLQRYDPNQSVARIREELASLIDQEIAARDEAFERTHNAEHQIAQMELAALPNDLAGQFSELSHYQFESEQARDRFQELANSLRSQSLTSQLSRSLRNLSTEDLASMRQAMEELTELIGRYNEGEDVEQDFQDFAQRHPEIADESQSFEEFLSELARRTSQMSAAIASLDEGERSELEGLLAALSQDAGMESAMSQLAQELSRTSAYRKGLHYGFRGSDPIEFGELTEVVGVLGELDDLESELSRASSPERLAQLDRANVAELLGPDASNALDHLQQLTDSLKRAGLIDRTADEFNLSPRALSLIGRSLLREMFPQGMAGRVGQHESPRTGWGTEASGEVKSYEYGDPFRLSLNATLKNALVRNGPHRPVSLLAEDFMVEQTESHVACSTVLALDLSLSMPLNDTFLPAKKVAFALATLINSQFARDSLHLVTFSQTAREISLRDLGQAQWDYAYGTNIEHALLLSRKLLRSRDGFRQIFLITDGEPTAHIDPHSSEPFFSYPTSPETLRRTLAEVVRVTKEHITINLFVLNADRSLRSFTDRVIGINHGKAFYPQKNELGHIVLGDYLTERSHIASGH